MFVLNLLLLLVAATFSSVAQAVEKVKRLDEIQPHNCRQNVEQRFSAQVMACGYESVYKAVSR